MPQPTGRRRLFGAAARGLFACPAKVDDLAHPALDEPAWGDRSGGIGAKYAHSVAARVIRNSLRPRPASTRLPSRSFPIALPARSEEVLQSRLPIRQFPKI